MSEKNAPIVSQPGEGEIIRIPLGRDIVVKASGRETGGAYPIMEFSAPGGGGATGSSRRQTEQHWMRDSVSSLACWPIAHPLECYRRARDLNLDGVAAYEAYWPSEAAMSEGNPHLIVERREAEELPLLLVLQGTADDVVPVEMQERFVVSYRAAGGQVDLVRFEGMPHTFVQRQPEHPESKRAIETMIWFVKLQVSLATAAGDKPRHNVVDTGLQRP